MCVLQYQTCEHRTLCGQLVPSWYWDQISLSTAQLDAMLAHTMQLMKYYVFAKVLLVTSMHSYAESESAIEGMEDSSFLSIPAAAYSAA